jgi:hypothetical protein
VEEVTGGPLYRDRVCGTGTGTAGSAATIRVPSGRDPARRVAETRSFGATQTGGAGAGGLAAVLAGARGGDGGGRGLPEGAVLPAGGRRAGVRAGRCRAGQGTCPAAPGGTRPVRGGWRRAAGRGAITSCCAAAPESGIIGLRTRYRRDLAGERTREKQRAGKLPGSAAITLSCVLAGLPGGDRPGHHGAT